MFKMAGSKGYGKDAMKQDIQMLSRLLVPSNSQITDIPHRLTAMADSNEKKLIFKEFGSQLW